MLRKNAAALVSNRKAGRPVHCFKISGEGRPEHPLYQTEGDLEILERWL
jgi:hypothetical protein